MSSDEKKLKSVLKSGVSTAILIFTKTEHGGADQGRHPSIGAGDRERDGWAGEIIGIGGDQIV